MSAGNQVGSTSETIYHDEVNNYWVKNRRQIDENKWAESITYFDGLGRAWKSEEVNFEGNIFVEKEFDSDGRVLRVSNPFRSGEAKVWTTNIYDEASRVKEVELQDGSKIKTDYGVSISGVVGVTKQITDQAGKKRKGITDALGRMVRVIEDPSGTPLNTDYIFDTLGNLRKTTQGDQNRYFMHDSLGRLLYAKQVEQDTNSNFSATDPVTGNTNWSVKYEYDDNSNITSTTDARNLSITATYDNLNRLKIRNYSETATPDVSFYYDGYGLGGITEFSKGKTTKVASSVSETRYTSFDELGRLLTHEQRTDGEIYETEYEYNLSGGLIKETYPSGREVHHEINADGDLSRVWGQEGSAITTYANAFNYNVNGAIEKMRLGNGKWETTQYNDRHQIIQIGLGAGSNDTSLLKLDLGYGDNTQNNGSLRSQTISFAGLANPFEQTYTYDDLNRLQVAEEKVSGNATWKQTFTIDRYGNRKINTAENNTTTLGSCAQKICNPLINTSDNRIQEDQDSDTVVDYAYDANGALVKNAKGERFTYDMENHQTEFFDEANSTSTPDATYRYDGEGKRVKKSVGDEVTVFVYNASGQLVAEYSTQISETPQVSYLTTDHLGSPRVITDQDGNITSRKDYTAFGEENFTAERETELGYTGQSETRKGYTGYEKDSESGLDFAQARYYNAVHGRFTSIDPLTASISIKNPQTFNRYSYVLNSPYKFTDPLGLIPETTAACGSRCLNSGPWVDGSAFRGRDTSFSPTIWLDTYTIPLNIVYDQNQYTEEQAKSAVADSLNDLESTYGELGIRFKVTYTAGTRDSSEALAFLGGRGASRIGTGDQASAINVFLYVTAAYSGGSGSAYNPESQQIMLWEGTNSREPKASNAQAKLSSGALAHEVGHLLLHHALGAPVSNVVTNGLQDIDIGLTLTKIRLGVYKRSEKELPITYKAGMSADVGMLFNLGARKLIKHWYNERQ